MKKTIRKNIYSWHKTIGLITVIPIIFWCLSGFMHPFLAHWFKPKIAHEIIVPKVLNQNHLKLSIKEVLVKNKISEFKKIRCIEFNNSTYYQVKNTKNQWKYFNTHSGQELIEGDKKYAEHLARYFLADSTSAVKSIKLQTDFSQQYKYINRLLPVWKVSFERQDNMDVYVETPNSRLGTFNPTSRKVFLWVFDNFHNWTFLEKISNNTFRISIMIVLLSIICFSALSGLTIYGFMWEKFKKPNPENKKGILRKYHRQIGISVALVTLTFAFSGGYHATRKIEPNVLPKMVYEPLFKTNQLPDTLPRSVINWQRITNFSLVKTDKKMYYQFSYINESNNKIKMVYYDLKNNHEWKNGNFKYAMYLSNYFKQSCSRPNELICCEMDDASNSATTQSLKIVKTEDVTSFEKREYGFAFKRLPVVRVSYDTPNKTNYYIETTTSRLAAKIENADRYEGYSFAIFHKFLFLDWAGKNCRDIAMMLSALGVLIVCIFGLIVYSKK